MSDSRGDKNAVFGGAPAVQQGMPTQNVMKDDFGFEIPVELVPLPSGGKTYPTDCSFHGQPAVQIRAMTAREEDILTSRALIKEGTVISSLIKSCLIDKTFNVRDLLSGDRNALMVALRVTGYGSDYSVDVDCPMCNERSKQEFNLTELSIKRLEIDPVTPGENLFEFKLPMTKAVVKFRFLTGKDEETITVSNARRKKAGFKTDNIVTQKFQYSIMQVGEHTDKVKIQRFIENMPARDSLELRRYMDQHEPGIDMRQWMNCPSCHEQSEVSIPLGVTFFWPDTGN